MTKPLKDVHTGEQVMLLQLALRIGVPCFLILAFIEYLVLPGMFLVLFIPNVLLSCVGVWIAWKFIGGVGSLAGAFVMPNSVTAVRQYSEQEALVIRGHREAAINSYRALIAGDPADLTARLRLGALLAEHPDTLLAAERCFLDVRRRDPSPQDEWIATNGLIDLYRASGQRENLKRELGHLGRRHGGTAAGMHARELLAELQAEDAAQAVTPSPSHQ
jgi:hypothetical protein